MKHFIIPMMLMAVAALASCEKQNTLNEPEAQKGTYTYTLSATAPDMMETDGAGNAQAPISKTDYNASGVFSWSVGDQISVLFHKDDDNKFFTFTTSGSGATADFTGTVDDGYTIGASDGDAMDKKIWALFPASANHSYTAGSFPKFYVQPSVDFSATHFSANIPMYALNAAEGALSFTNIASTYKFIVTGIKAGVSKVQFRIHNQETYGLSGLWDIINHGSTEIKELEYEYASPGSANSTLTYINNVTSNQAVFYVSCRYWGHFQPVVTVTNCATGVDIKTFTASTYKSPNYMDHVWPITLDVSEANGGDYFAPAISIDGDMSDWDPSNNANLTDGTNYKAVVSGSSKWKEFRVAYDSRYVYFYVKRNYTSELWTAGGYFWFKFDKDGDSDYEDTVFYIEPFTIVNTNYTFLSSAAAKSPAGTASGSFSVSCAGVYDATDVELEVMASRADLGINKNDVIGIRSNSNKSAGDITISGTLTVNN